MMVSDYDRVILAEVSEEDLWVGFAFNTSQPAAHYFFSSHQQSPETILYLGEQLYQKKPIAFLLGISGYTWELGDDLSQQAKTNLKSAIKYIQSIDFQIINSKELPKSET